MAVCPPPLSAIETPRISDHEGNNSKNLAPKYSFMSIVAPLTPIASTPSHEDIPTNTSTIGQTNHFKGKYYGRALELRGETHSDPDCLYRIKILFNFQIQ